jgi:hypothetical protein
LRGTVAGVVEGPHHTLIGRRCFVLERSKRRLKPGWGSADDARMARRSVRGLRRKMQAAKSEKKAMTPRMRQLMATFEAQYGQDAQFKQGQQEADRR